ncbi:FAD/FMN-containing dehydrogenase [Geosmithia morbida]|uniref:FAD/FMN-containing dehydrogenase n=1 Tax=Geosmithia morbida TaxID=1094350 RepID=A0A9P4YQM0_9HYPO|nr:FAD/FMN-containing dehydrogenase [Geosmithia morbida]KAF4121326.1 FAD/FMN-containing dehydrogenase [Geosmithia morbida]
MVSLQTGADCACTKLAAEFEASSVLFAESTNYTTQTLAYWDKRAVLEPKCIFLPTSAEDVATAVKTFASCGTQFAVRGGGHMNNPGSNSIEGGVLLAFDNMATVRVSADNNTVHVGPGARWEDVYSGLDPYGLYCVGGRMKTIGVAGLELIGGFHYFNNKYGMSMDNVASYDVVLGNGTQVTANATSHPDLFWGLKGGSSNFGIVTNFEIKTLPITKVSTTIQVFDDSAMRDFIEATVNLALRDGPDIAAGSIITISRNVTTGTTSALLLGVQEGEESPPSRFSGFSAIPSTSSQNNVSKPIEWHSKLDSPFQLSRVQFGHGTIKPNAAQLYRIFESWRDAVDDIADVEGVNPTFVLNLLPKSALSVAKNNGIGNTWGLEDDQAYILWQLVTNWDNAVDDIRITNWARRIIDHWQADNEAKGLAHPFLYAGDAAEYQDVFATFPSESRKRMNLVRKEYDPLEVFSRLNWGGFKLFTI